MPEVTGKRILGKYDSKDGTVYLTNYGTGVLKIDEAPKKMVEEWKKAEKGITVDDSYTYRIEDGEAMSQSLLADDREDYVFGALVKGATKLAKSAGKSLLSKAEQATIKNSKEYKDVVKELTTDNAQGAGVTWSKAELKQWEKDYPADMALEAFNEFRMSKETHDRYANELIDAGVKPSSVKRILSLEFKDKDLTEGERSIRKKFKDKYFPKAEPPEDIEKALEEGLAIDSQGNILAPVDYKKPILIEHRAGKEPRAEGGEMSSSLLDEKDLDFPNTQVTKTMQSRERVHTTPSASPDIGFPGGGVRQPFIFGSLAKLGTKAARSLLADATKEVKKAQKNLPKGKELKEIEDRIESNRQYLSHGDNERDLFTPDEENRMMIRDLEFEMSKVPALAKAITNLRSKIYKDYKDIEVANRVYIDELEKIENKYLEEGKDIQWNAQEKGMQEAQDYDAMMREGGPESLSEYRARKPEYYKEMPPTKDFEDFGDFLERQEKDRIGKHNAERERTRDRSHDSDPPPTDDSKEVDWRDIPWNRGGRVKKQEGSLMVPPEMEQDMPVDTYPNIPPEEMADAEASQLPDAEMEDKYINFVMEESLDDEEQSYLMNALEADPKLSQIFDKVISTASEFTGSGEVAGPGTGVSDSIPARLSDGEFVFTKKATDEMGADNLQQMMDDAERAHDGGVIRRSAQEGGLLMYKQKDEDPLAYEKIAQDEIKKNMLRSNRAPSLNPGQI